MSDHDEQQGGEVSEVSGMDPVEADTPIQPDQATQGGPEQESGEVQTDPTAGHRGHPDNDLNRKDEGPGQKPADDKR